MKNFVLVSFVFCVACGQAEQEAAEAALNPNKKATTAQVTATEAFAPAAGTTWNTYYVADASNLPVCDFDREGQLFYVGSEKKFYACQSNDWQVVELKGRDGLQGEKGDRGEQGLQGEKGEKGEGGLDGVQGLQGERGERGEQGVAGRDGLDGAQGLQGERGERGEQGVAGAQGPQGEKGEKGDRGEQGLQGEQGVAGAQGLQGLQGATGAAGAKGDKGDPGVAGAEVTSLQDCWVSLDSQANFKGYSTWSPTTESGTDTYKKVWVRRWTFASGARFVTAEVWSLDNSGVGEVLYTDSFWQRSGYEGTSSASIRTNFVGVMKSITVKMLAGSVEVSVVKQGSSEQGYRWIVEVPATGFAVNNGNQCTTYNY